MLYEVITLCFNPSANVYHGVSSTKLQIQDIDGDGFPDVLESEKDDDLKVKRSTIGRTNLLKKVNRPLGAEITLDYKRVGNTYNLPFNIWTLSKLETFDGFESDGVDVTMSTFDFV